MSQDYGTATEKYERAEPYAEHAGGIQRELFTAVSKLTAAWVKAVTGGFRCQQGAGGHQPPAIPGNGAKYSRCGVLNCEILLTLSEVLPM